MARDPIPIVAAWSSSLPWRPQHQATPSPTRPRWPPYNSSIPWYNFPQEGCSLFLWHCRWHAWYIYHLYKPQHLPLSNTPREDNMVKLVVTWLTKWVSSLTYPWKPKSTLCICFDPRDLNKAIIWEHYKAPTWDKIYHHLSRATTFTKLDAKDRFQSVNLDEKSSYLATFNTNKMKYWFLWMPFSLKMSRDIFQMYMDLVTDQLATKHHHKTWHLHLWLDPREAWQAAYSPYPECIKEWNSAQ